MGKLERCSLRGSGTIRECDFVEIGMNLLEETTELVVCI